MAKEVGFSRNLKLRWLNIAADYAVENLSEKEFKDRINYYLSFEIKSPTNLRKTCDILNRLWRSENNKNVLIIREQALKLLQKYDEYKVLLHWCLLLNTYPLFADICRIISRFLDFKDEIELSRLKQKIYDEWSERTTLKHSLDKIISTLKDMEILEVVKPGIYKPKIQDVKNDELISFMIYAAMQADGKAYYPISNLKTINLLFPFRYENYREPLYNNDSFEFATFGRETAVLLKENNYSLV